MSRARARVRKTDAQPRTRREAMQTFGAVHVLQPGGTSRYYRLTWTDPITGKQCDTTAGTDYQKAAEKAARQDRELQALRAGVSRTETVGSLVCAYGQDVVGRGEDGTNASASRLADVKRHLKRATAGYADVKLIALDRKLVDAMRAQAGTGAPVRENTPALRLLLRWGHRKGLLDTATGELLGSSAPAVEPTGPKCAASTAPARRRTARRVGASVLFVEDAPPLAEVRALRDQIQALQPRWGALSVELAGGCGPRWGEQFQLTAYDVLESAEVVEIQINWQIDAKAKRKEDGDAKQPDLRKLPKGEKTRVTTVPATSQTGFPLAQALLARRDAALAEQAAGVNPEALLFPTKTGKLFIHTAFSRDVFKPAAIAAGWPFQEWEAEEKVPQKTGGVATVVRRRIQFDLTWHSLRHRYARFAIDVLHFEEGELTVQGGWEDVEIVRKRYYKSGEEHRESSRQKVQAAAAAALVVAPPVAEPVATDLTSMRLGIMSDLRSSIITIEVYRELIAELDRMQERAAH